MNLFLLDTDPVLAAKRHKNVHVVKMTLETAQILSTAHFIADGFQVGYKPTHLKHPVVRWCAERWSHYNFTYSMFVELAAEYHRRYGRFHSSFTRHARTLKQCPLNCDDGPITEFACAMPEQYRNGCERLPPLNAMLAYRWYYQHEKRHLA